MSPPHYGSLRCWAGVGVWRASGCGLSPLPGVTSLGRDPLRAEMPRAGRDPSVDREPLVGAAWRASVWEPTPNPCPPLRSATFLSRFTLSHWPTGQQEAPQATGEVAGTGHRDPSRRAEGPGLTARRGWELPQQWAGHADLGSAASWLLWVTCGHCVSPTAALSLSFP